MKNTLDEWICREIMGAAPDDFRPSTIDADAVKAAGMAVARDLCRPWKVRPPGEVMPDRWWVWIDHPKEHRNPIAAPTFARGICEALYLAVTGKAWPQRGPRRRSGRRLE